MATITNNCNCNFVITDVIVSGVKKVVTFLSGDNEIEDDVVDSLKSNKLFLLLNSDGVRKLTIKETKKEETKKTTDKKEKFVSKEISSESREKV